MNILGLISQLIGIKTLRLTWGAIVMPKNNRLSPMHQAHTSPSEEAQTGPWRESILDKRKRKEQGGGDGRETQQTQRGKRKEKGKGKKRMGAYGPLVRDIVLAIMPIICTISPFISEKPPPRGCRHCWANHVNYCVYCRVFSFSNLYLIGLSHSIGLLSCPISLLKRFRTYPFATRVFLTLQQHIINLRLDRFDTFLVTSKTIWLHESIQMRHFLLHFSPTINSGLTLVNKSFTTKFNFLT